MSFGHLGAAVWYLWSIICGMSSKISVSPTSQRQFTLWKTIFVKPLVKNSCLKILWPAEASIWMKLFSIIKRKDVLSNKKRNLRKYSVVFLKYFPKKKKKKIKLFSGPCIYSTHIGFPLSLKLGRGWQNFYSLNYSNTPYSQDLTSSNYYFVPPYIDGNWNSIEACQTNPKFLFWWNND